MSTLQKTFQNKNFVRLWLSQLVSQFGDRIHQLALVGLVALKAPQSASSLAHLLAFSILPVFVVQPVAGVFVDRWEHRKTMFVCDIGRFLIVLMIPFVVMAQQTMIPVYIIVFLVFCFSRFHVPAKMAMIPEIVEDEDLHMANSLISTTGMIAFVFGCAAGGFLVDIYGAINGFYIDALTFLCAGVLIASIKPKRERARAKQTSIKEVRQDMIEGLSYIAGHKDIRFVINMLFVLLCAAGAVYVVIIVFIQESFNSVTKDLGVLAVALGAGLFCGALLYGRWGKKFNAYKVIFACLSFGGLLLIVFALIVSIYANMFLTLILSFFWGIVLGPIFIATNTMVHLVSDKEMRGKVFSALEMVIHLGFLLSMLASSYLSDYIPRGWILMGVGCILVVIGLIGVSKKDLRILGLKD